MAKDYIPRKEAQIISWATKLSADLAQHGASLGLSPADITAGQNACADMIAVIQDYYEARAQYRSKKANRDDTKRTATKTLRGIINRAKVHTAFSEVYGMHVFTAADAAPDNNFKPEFKLKNMGHYVAVHFKKLGATGVHIYSKREGEAEFRFVAYSTRSPFKDKTPLQQPGVPEVREYKMVAVRHDEQVGQFSNTGIIVFAGR